MLSTGTTAVQRTSDGNVIERSIDRPDLLQPTQILKTVAVGVLFWFVAAMAVRFGTPAGWYEGTARLAAFAIGVPIGWLTVWFVKRIVSLQSAQVVPCIAIGTAAATLCDGIALTWGGLYGPDPAKVLPGAAWILWGVGLILLFAYVDASRSARRQPKRVQESR